MYSQLKLITSGLKRTIIYRDDKTIADYISTPSAQHEIYMRTFEVPR